MISFLKNWALSIVTLVLFLLMIEIMMPSGNTKIRKPGCRFYFASRYNSTYCRGIHQQFQDKRDFLRGQQFS